MIEIGDLVYNTAKNKIGWIAKPFGASGFWTVEYADGKIERHSESVIRNFKIHLDYRITSGVE